MSEEAYRRKLLHRNQSVIAAAVVPAPFRTRAIPTGQPNRRLRYALMAAGVVMLLFGVAARSSHGAERQGVLIAVRSPMPNEISAPHSEPLKLPDSQLEPIDWNALERWAADDHVAAFTTFLTSCRPLLRTTSEGETRPMYFALKHVCRGALSMGPLGEKQARLFFERNFRPVRISKMGGDAGLLTGYYEPIVEGSRFPTGTFKVPIYRRPPDLVPPVNNNSPGFANGGPSLRRTTSGELVPYYDRAEILNGALDGQHLEIFWVKNDEDALLMQVQGAARVRLEDGTMLRISYDAHNGYPFVPVSRVLIERNIIPREEISVQRIREWMRANPQGAEEVRRQNRSFVFFRIVGLADDQGALGAQGVPLIPGRSIAIDRSLHVYGTPIFIQASLPLTSEKGTASFDRLMIAQDTGSAIVGPARADIFWGAGDRAARLAGRTHHPGSFVMLVPRELDPVATEAQVPLPPEKPPLAAEARVRTPLPASRAIAFGRDLGSRSR